MPISNGANGKSRLYSNEREPMNFEQFGRGCLSTDLVHDFCVRWIMEERTNLDNVITMNLQRKSRIGLQTLRDCRGNATASNKVWVDEVVVFGS